MKQHAARPLPGGSACLSLKICEFLVDAVRCVLGAVLINMHLPGNGPVPHAKWSDQHVPVGVTFGIKWSTGCQTSAT